MSNFYEYESVQAGLPIQLRPNYIHQLNNNGVTLPSPTGLPFPDPHHQHQRSPSQFQVIGSGGPNQQQHKQAISQINKSSSSTLQHTQSKQQQITPHQPRPNSLPRRSQRGTFSVCFKRNSSFKNVVFFGRFGQIAANDKSPAIRAPAASTARNCRCADGRTLRHVPQSAATHVDACSATTN